MNTKLKFVLLTLASGLALTTTRATDITPAEAGMADAWAEQTGLKKRIDAKELTSGDLFGTREHLKNNYAYRMAGGIIGIYANSKAKAKYPAYTVDAEGRLLDGTTKGYTLRFAQVSFRRSTVFLSLTMYELPSSLLSANPISRYLLNSPMLRQFRRHADGGLTLLIQNESPGEDKQSNWLPAPKGPFFMAMRLYWPKEEALTSKWTAPPLTRAD